MARPRQHAFRVKLNESAGNDREAVARVLQTWAILLADQAQRAVVNELRQHTQLRPEDYDGKRCAVNRHPSRILGRRG